MVARLIGYCPGLPMVVCVDETEPMLDEYRALGVDLVVRPGEAPGVAAKIAYTINARMADVYVLLSDRCVPVGDWYWPMTAAAARKVALCECRFDGAPRGFSAVMAIHRACIDAVGWVAPPGVEHYGVDNFWNHAPKAAGKSVRVGVQIDIPDYRQSDAVRMRTLARRAEYEAQWLRFRASPDYAAAVERLKRIA